VVVFQLKLMVDGLRDVVLVPTALVAGFIGFLRGGDDPQQEFKWVIQLGLRSERWIDLFGQHEEEAAGEGPSTRSMDTVVATLEQRLKQKSRAEGRADGSRDEDAPAPRPPNKFR